MQETCKLGTELKSVRTSAAFAPISGRHSLDGWSMPSASSIPAVQPVRIKQHGDAAAAQRHATAPRSSLIQISSNLPEAPAAFRHMPLSPAGKRHHPLHGRREAGDASDHAGCNSQSSHPHSRSLLRSVEQAHDAATAALPGSPKRKQQQAQHGAWSGERQCHGSQSRTTSSGVTAPKAEAEQGAAALFTDPGLDAGPPRLAQVNASLVSALHPEGLDGSAWRYASSTCRAEQAPPQDNVAAGNAVKLPLRPSDFSRCAMQAACCP